MSVNAYVLVQTEVGKSSAVAAAIAELTGVDSAEHVTGPYDVIVRVSSTSIDELGSMVVSSIQQISGITRTLTCPVVRI